ncbi:alpha/beta hydrolase [Desulfosarcina widdelii]|uniref:Alpha/beta hydrolase n=1 Tax=Desulfosarcina widdelii TaxID=947919 RepID=A0A5K7Z035_9BACT|nr:alpha/beta hydrolase [Desulfosarcina widdelii]BBO74248.1 alpha/beta hydrolase [Desulfosarcina widdelii]
MHKGIKKDIVTIIIFSLAAYPVVVMAAHFSQSYAIFQSRGPSLSPPRHLEIDERFLATPDGQRLYAWWLQTGDAKKTVLYFQANGTNISQKIFRIETFKEMGVNALLIDYRGYGKSTGRIKQEQHIYTDGQTAWNYLVDEKRIDQEDIIVWGRSLGGAVASEIARGKKIAALVLESTFLSLDTVARRQYWFLPTTRLLKYHFENGRKLKQVRAPVVIIHSMEDDYVPFSQARKLYEAASEPRYLIETTGSHIDSFDRQWAFFGSSANRSGNRQQVLFRVMESIGLDTSSPTRHTTRSD